MALYNLLIHLLLPLVVTYVIVGRAWGHRGAIEIGRRWRVPEVPSAPPGRKRVVCHAASLGENRAIGVLIRSMRERWPELDIGITVTTSTGLAEAGRQGIADWQVHLPLDFPWMLGPFLDRLKPDLVLVAESEIWPNFLSACHARGIPVIYVNGRLSSRTESVYQAFCKFYSRILRPVRLFLVQGESEVRRLRMMGQTGNRVQVVGDLKADRALLAARGVDAATLRASLGLLEGPVLVAGSTHEGEEAVLIEAVRILQSQNLNVNLVLAPRHLERLGRIISLLQRGDLTWRSRSDGLHEAPVQVLLIDTYGELADLYAVGDFAFVGGSLVDVGGHSLVEPAVFAQPLIVGPFARNFQTEVECLASYGGLEVVDGPDTMASVLGRWMLSPDRRVEAGAGARRAVESMGGALERTVGAIECYMEN